MTGPFNFPQRTAFAWAALKQNALLVCADELQKLANEIKAAAITQNPIFKELLADTSPSGSGKNECRDCLAVVLDQVDYTAGACTPTEMIGACLSRDVIASAKVALANSIGAL